MARDKLLAEWFWTDRWTGSSAFLLPLEARGLYREMLSAAWRRGAKLPTDHDAIKRVVGATDEEWDRSWPKIAHYFRTKRGHFVNETQVEIYQKTRAIQAVRSQSGRRGGLKAQALKRGPVRPDLSMEVTTKSERKNDAFSRRISAETSTVSPALGRAQSREGVMGQSFSHQATLQANTQANGQAKLKPPSPSPSPDLRTERTDPAIVPYVGKHRTAGDDVEARAGRFCERFAELFLQHRGGARYYQQPNLDWQRVCRLLTVWDAARLEKLAVLLLTTDDPWISGTGRNIAILEKKASFLDDLLRQWEQAQGTPV